MCLFCKIIKKEIPSQILYEDDICLAFGDINPKAPVHVLVVPKKHIASLNEASEEDCDILGHILVTIKKIAQGLGIDKNGYRTVINTNKDAGQDVFHIHVHVLGGRAMHWPPG